MTTLIIANGDIDDIEWLRPIIVQAAAVIAADGGTRHLLRLGHQPDVLIGDLDSLDPKAAEWRSAEGVEVYVYPHDKNETDLELALLHAVAHYDGDIVIAGAMGGRLDQTLANIMLLAHPALEGRHVELITEHQRAWLAQERALFSGEMGDTVSLVPVGGDVLVSETKGLRWPLQDEVLSVGPARGISNEMTESSAIVEIGYGTLLCIHTESSWQR